MSTDEMLQELNDRHALTQLVARYARAVDWLDIDDMKACFHPDAMVAFGENKLGAHEFCDLWRGMGRKFKTRHHHCAVPVIELQGRDRAYVEFAAFAVATREVEGGSLRDFLECNRYVFHVERRDAIWRVASGRIFVTWSLGSPTPSRLESGGPIDYGVDVSSPHFVKLPPLG